LTLPQNIILVGFMASGKSHVGRVLSQQVDWPLIDADEEIVKQQGMSIQSIFEKDGEAAFREVERSIIATLCSGEGTVIAAGGGAFLDSDNRRLMLASGTVFCLSAKAETIYSRIRKDTGPGVAIRPLLAGDNPRERIKTLLAQRAEAYSQAHYIVQTDSLTPEQVAERILQLCSCDDQTQAGSLSG
jgi:shikimate kinase